MREVLPESIHPEFVVTGGVAEVTIPVELMADVEPLWKCFVVGYFMNDAPHIGSIHSTVNRIWSSPGKVSKIDVQFIGKRTVLFRVEDAQVRSRIIKRKFWHISEVPLVLNVWTPESAKAPPDLSAMPLWVDLDNVPGYLYSKQGLSFLSRTAGKFVKLHPTTECCVRLDVARVLVEVDLAKPLPRKICFKGKDGREVNVGVNFPWLPPCCSVCSKWGHNEKDCHEKQEVVILKRPEMEKQLTVEAGKIKDSDVGIGREAVSELLNELEQLPVNALLAKNVGENGRELSLFLNNLSSGVESEKWVTLGEQGSNRSSPTREKVLMDIVAFPNSFQALQGIREEGEIDDDDDIGDDLNLKVQDKRDEVDTEVGNKGQKKKAGQSTGQRGKGRGKALIANMRGLVNAVVSGQSKKVSSRRNK